MNSPAYGNDDKHKNEVAVIYAKAFLERLFFRVGKLMFSSTKTTPSMATCPPWVW